MRIPLSALGRGAGVREALGRSSPRVAHATVLNVSANRSKFSLRLNPRPYLPVGCALCVFACCPSKFSFVSLCLRAFVLGIFLSNRSARPVICPRLSFAEGDEPAHLAGEAISLHPRHALGVLQPRVRVRRGHREGDCFAKKRLAMTPERLLLFFAPLRLAKLPPCVFA
jgi:hypothetical protein